MTAKDIKAGMSCTVGWFHTGYMCSRTDYLAAGKIIFRRGGRIKLQRELGDSMVSDFPGTPHYSSEFYWVSVLDIKSINGTPLKDWLAQEPQQARTALAAAKE